MTLPAEEIRIKMLELTLQLMDEDGLDAIKARPIAKQIGVSVGTVYNLFGSIDGLIQEANGKILEEFSSKVLSTIQNAEAATEVGSSPSAEKLKSKLLLIAQTYMLFVERYETRWGAMLAYNQKRSVDILSEQYETQQASLFSWLGNSLAGTPVGETENSRKIAARMLWSAVHGIVVLNYVGQATEQSRAYTWEQIELFVETFVKGVTV